MAEDWAPVVADVGAILRARTLDTNGNEVGTFNAATRPTGDQVTALINDAVSDVASAVGQKIPFDQYDSASTVTATLAAAFVELSFFPEQVNSGRSPYAQLMQLYKDRLQRLVLAVEHEGTDLPGSEYMTPAGAFGGNPLPIQWYTQW